MNENELSQHVALLLQRSAGIIKKYDELYRLKGLKYNIFEIARISEREVIICRVIADLLNPKGSHYKGDLYLKLFWDIVSPKMGGGIALNTAKAEVTTEYSTDAQRRIDIVIGDGNIFVPLEAKIWAREQERQVGDYAKYSKIKNKGKNILVLFLTLDGRPSETAQANEYASVSFKKDIVSWLEQCLLRAETENTPPVREVIKQLLSAIKSIFEGMEEDKKMSKEIAERVMASEETMQAALEIKKWLDENTLDKENCGGLPAWELFKGAVFKIVKKQFPLADIDENDDKWYDINVPIKNGIYTLYVNYDWQSIALKSARTKGARSAEAKKLAQKMTELTGVTENDGWAVWATAQARYLGLETVNEAIYPYLLYKKYEQNPEEAASHIIKMVTELEKT